MRLDALPTASAGDLLEALLGSAPGLEDLGRLLIHRTQGNPFFLEESVRALVETEALSGERAAYRVAGSIQSLQLPATAQAILAFLRPAIRCPLTSNLAPLTDHNLTATGYR